MGVKKIKELYYCQKCGNEVIVTKVGGGTLMCCGKEMQTVRNVIRIDSGD
jgi:desulfoferrodoxin-like iron-binding protein